MSNEETIREYVVEADLVIGAVLVPGAAAPKLVSREMVREMRDGSVIVDIAIDQGGCFETSRPTTHQSPDLYRRRRRALLRDEHAGRSRAHVGACAQQRDAPLRQCVGRPRACGAAPTIRTWRAGLNVHRGAIAHPAVAEALGYPVTHFLPVAA